uniref:Mitochondrial cardiolipin hydrolase n=1 Tax=Dromaius novaehollandiae TaxID=8790 RepID=A0A8C4KAS7_DRONO
MRGTGEGSESSGGGEQGLRRPTHTRLLPASTRASFHTTFTLLRVAKQTTELTSCRTPASQALPTQAPGGRLGEKKTGLSARACFHTPQLGRAVQLLHRRGVRVRVVTDAQYMALNGSQIGLLRRAGIPVRHDQENGFMHHKFAIVDKKMLITGSLNWTTQAIQNNRENVLIVDDAEYVKPFLAEFERIWEEYNPINYTFFSKENK